MINTRGFTRTPQRAHHRASARWGEAGARLVSGFTLIEVLIAMAIATIGITVVTYFTLDISRFGIDLGNRLETERESELLLRTILTEIRSMGPAANGAYPIATATGTSFTFYTDVDADNVLEQVRYFIDGMTLKRGVTEPSGIPAQYPPASETIRESVHYLVAGTTVFSFYPEGDPTVTGPLSAPVNIADIRMVGISLTTDKDPAGPPLPITVAIMAMIRNLRGEI
jgi:prepilin-type N-terminal cleavage/methylation domain-containing protein